MAKGVAKVLAMKTKYLAFGLAAILAITGAWFARAASRAHRQIVTLDVYEMPLRDVLRKIEKQTWNKIRAEENLDARITLHVVNQPLTNVLDKIATQAGARWSTLFAVYNSSAALAALDSTLRRDGKIDRAGWTKLAPNDSAFDKSGPPDENASFKGGPPGEAPPKFFVNAPPGETGNREGPPGPPPEGGGFGGRMMVGRTANGDTVIKNGNGQIEHWSPTELLMQSALTNRLNGEPIQSASAEEADAAAQKTNGKRATFFAFRKSIMGVGSPALGAHRGPDAGPPGRNDRFANLTPEQRVERARERQNHQPQMIQKN
jgi:hypothetical protein